MTEVASEAPDAVLAALDPEQREVALATRGPVCVLAGAGTGKTRAITHRIAYAAAVGHLNPAHVLALTFTVRAAGEMRGRLRQLGAGQVRASTFHAAALRQLNYFWPRVVGGRPPRLVDSKAALVREAAKQAGVRLDSPGVADAAAEIEWAKALQVRPDGYPRAARAAGRTPAAGPDPVAAVFAGYERLRRERNLIDFESVLELTAAIVLEHRGAADQVRASFRYFVVDEYQDVNPLQKLLLDAWLGDRDELCVVGDPHQVIYSFTGATPAYLTGFAAEYPGATVVRMVRDYRSTPQVVAVANQLLRGYGGTGSPSQGGSGGMGPPVERCWSGEGRRPPRASTHCPAAARPAAGADCSLPTTRPRRPGWPSRSGPCWPGACRPGKSPSWSGSTPTPSGSSRPWARPGSRTWCAAPSGSTSGPWCARRWSCCAARPAAPTRGTPCPPRSGTC